MKRFNCRALALLGIAVSCMAQAQEYPGKPIRWIVPYTPGGGTDTFARVIGQKMSEAWGQQVLIENRPGAGGNIATELVAKAPADGYMILAVGPFIAVNLSIYSKLGYDPVRDFTPITQFAAVNTFLVVHPSMPVKSVKELIALAKAPPGQINYGSGGPGSTPHLATELMQNLAGIKLVHVPYKGVESVIGLMRGEISMLFESLISLGGNIQSGRVRVLAVGSAKRALAMPEVPTLAEAGVPGYEMVSWFGVLAPAGTPKPVIAKLNAEIARALNLPDIKQRLLSLGAEPVGNTPEQFDALIKSEITKWAGVAKAGGIRVD